MQFRKIKIIYKKIQLLFSKFKKKYLKILELPKGIKFTFWITGVLENKF